jgi:uncharacterized repeat protein (TIGR03803 family)
VVVCSDCAPPFAEAPRCSADSGNSFDCRFYTPAERRFDGVNSTYSVLYNLCALLGCVDGMHPDSGVAVANRTVFGTTGDGGGPNAGIVFKVRGGTFSKLYEFCSQTDSHAGQNPVASVIVDPSATENGGSAGHGTVFRLMP